MAGRRCWLVLACVWLAGGCAVTSKQTQMGGAEKIESVAGVRNLSRDGDIWFAGQPTEDGLANLKRAGVRRVINLRTDEEMTEKVEFDEVSAVRELGMDYVSIPFRGGTVDVQHADELARVLSQSNEPTLLHCGSSNRVGAVWAIYQHRHNNVSVDEAIRLGRAAGMTSEGVEDRARQILK